MEDKSLVPVRILHDFADKADRLGINYMLTGSTAMLKYSVYRYTADMNVVVVKYGDAKQMIETFEPEYYVPHGFRWAIDNRKMFNVIHQETAFRINCVIKNPANSTKMFLKDAKKQIFMAGRFGLSRKKI